MDKPNLRRALSLYLIVDLAIWPGDPEVVVRSSINAGVSCVQLRAKDYPADRILTVARELRQVCSELCVPLIINDHLDIALAIGADGVHLGVDDVDPEHARELAGVHFIIGFSPETDDQVRNAAARGISYLGIGPVFGTASKADAGAALGANECARRLSLTPLPAVAIGGVDSANAHLALGIGADGIAVVSAILTARDPALAAADLRSIVDSARTSTRLR